jgi:3-phenylpropionate/cinnamic acid dioxygenase small subunit
MEKTLQYLLDRREIEDQAILYAHLIDTRQFDRLVEVFTPDAYIDYKASGGEAGALSEIIPFLEKALPMFKNTQHLMSNVMVSFAPDCLSATGQVMLFNPMTITIEDKDVTMFVGLWYEDDWVKAPDGWRIAKRVQKAGYAHNQPW